MSVAQTSKRPLGSSLPRDIGPVYSALSGRQDWRALRPVFYMRFAHVPLFLAYIASAGGIVAGLLPLSAMLTALTLYFIATLFMFFRVNRLGLNAQRVRICMYLDLAILFFAWCHDPYRSGPTIVMVLIILLGNGLRHGVAHYREAALAVCLLAPPIAFLRGQFAAVGLPPEAVFTIAFTLVSMAYGYVLVSRLWDSHKELETQNRFDDVTGLYSRRSLRVMAQNALERCRRDESSCTLLYLDLDNFKQVNDRYGHADGDEALRSIAQSLHRVLPTDSVLGRYGGDEFVVVLPWSDPLRLARVVQELQDAVRDVATQWPRTRLAVSIGSATAPIDGVALDALLSHADHGMYRRKRRAQLIGQRLLPRKLNRPGRKIGRRGRRAV